MAGRSLTRLDGFGDDCRKPIEELRRGSLFAGANCAAVIQYNMSDSKHSGGAGKRRPATALPRKEPSWTALLIKLAIAIILFNIFAGVLAWYFLFSPRK